MRKFMKKNIVCMTVQRFMVKGGISKSARENAAALHAIPENYRSAGTLSFILNENANRTISAII